MTDRLLLVDDEPEVLSALRRELAKEGFEITACGDPAEALTAIDREEFAIIMSDNVMPGGSGLDLLAAARDRWQLTRRLLLTGATELEDAVAAFNSGSIHRFIHKPWQRADLVRLLREEAEIYRTERGAREKQTLLEETAKARTAKLLETLDELKQSRTQVALFEDTVNPEKLSISPRVAGLAIWVVDDNDGVRELLVTTLRKLGIKQCVGIPSAIDALWRLQSKQDVQVILSEWKMTPLDGLAFLRRLREEGGPSAKVKFILVTGREQRPLVEFALNAGVDGYIMKPFRLQSLFDHIDSLYQKESARMGQLEQQLGTLTCLIVNQHGASCDQMSLLLSAAGLKNVFTAHAGQTALRQLNDRRIDVLIYDLNVKQPDWRELRKELRKMLHTPALLLTSVLPTQGEVAEMKREGITHFLPGPFRQAELLVAVAKAAGLHAEPPPPPSPGG
jgi:DNA-binding NtrC family response regulator